MFNLNAIYRFHIIQDDGVSDFLAQVTKVEGSLVEVYSPHHKPPRSIYNASSQLFIRADLVHETPATNYWELGERAVGASISNRAN
jgi:hypothetical protein